MGQSPTIKEAQAIADEIFADFVAEEVDKVELVYTKFVSLISSGEAWQARGRLQAGGACARDCERPAAPGLQEERSMRRLPASMPAAAAGPSAGSKVPVLSA